MRKQHSRYGYLGKIMQSKSIIKLNKMHNRLLHSENQLEERNQAVNVSAAIGNQNIEYTIFLLIVSVSEQSGGNMLNTYAFLDNGSTVSIIDQSLQEKLRAQICTQNQRRQSVKE